MHYEVGGYEDCWHGGHQTDLVQTTSDTCHHDHQAKHTRTQHCNHLQLCKVVGWFGYKGLFSSQVEATKEQSAVHILAPAHGAMRYHSSSCVPSTSKVTLRALRGFPFPS